MRHHAVRLRVGFAELNVSISSLFPILGERCLFFTMLLDGVVFRWFWCLAKFVARFVVVSLFGWHLPAPSAATRSSGGSAEAVPVSKSEVERAISLEFFICRFVNANFLMWAACLAPMVRLCVGHAGVSLDLAREWDSVASIAASCFMVVMHLTCKRLLVMGEHVGKERGRSTEYTRFLEALVRTMVLHRGHSV